MSFVHRITFLFRFLSACTVVLACTQLLTAQSTNQNYPTPITSNEISGTIKARDVGDNRITSYYYQFDADQGDLFINLLTRNFTGDIDVFTINGLRPLTKIIVYADYGENETGRVLYFRKPERMILRVQGRTPSDDPATFRIKFAGSFVASRLAEPAADPELTNVTTKNDSGIRVNSVGTIVEVIPKATPTPRDVPTVADIFAEKPEPEKQEPAKTETEVKTEAEVKSAAAEPAATTEEPRRKLEVAVTDNLPAANPPTPGTRPATRRPGRGQRRTPPKPATTETAAQPAADKPTEIAAEPTADKPAETPAEKPTVTAQTDSPTASAETPTTTPSTSRRGARPAKPPETKAPDPMANINLVISFKDGSTLKRPMSEVERFSVDKGILTVVAKDGRVGLYSIFDVLKVTIE